MRYNTRGGYPGRGYQERRKTRKVLLIILVAILVAAAVLVGLMAYMAKAKAQQEAVQQDTRLLGIACMEQGDYREALEQFAAAYGEKEEKLSNFQIDINLYMAECHQKLEEYDTAMSLYDEILAQEDNAGAYFQRGTLRLAMGKELAAIEDYNKAAEMEDEEFDLYFAMYDILTYYGKEDAAFDLLSRALEIKAKDTEASYKHGQIYYILGQMDEAIKVLSKIVEDEVEAEYLLFLSYDSKGDEEKALGHMESFLERSQNGTSTQLYEIGCRMLELKRYEDAEALFEQALGLDKVPNQQEIMKKLVITHEQTMDFAAALEVMEEYVELYPEDEEAYKEYLFLQTRVNTAE